MIESFCRTCGGEIHSYVCVPADSAAPIEIEHWGIEPDTQWPEGRVDIWVHNVPREAEPDHWPVPA